ncbi:MAG: Zn-dependent hydrolase [Ferroplasma sp. Type II]|jgi:glyoxylase-like metal-dependent hydrolase (beta-lactamase superfamily II)|uniref:MBL fold metallo-hydrolase n=1 Tax=Ferroplasma sp. Type II TaxID=261388 RepID=UPI0003896D69|nr:MBL fold metallo-hydrolase [Ferroplasma sp. Type II]EQB73539.1 MAG: Zn-dependent hydrolase [Ferroplasma sp. Type II]HIH60738.1 MBL fold metallo-hydrolase [Ferroplasma sp.]HII82834.1 MBL fold metallo-hydrolase [Ferroplasma sp.]
MNSVEKISVPIEIRALKTANIYHISGDYNYIVDTGMSENGYSQIKNAIDLSKIDMCIITHLHIDHIGGALYLEKYNKIPIYISKNDYDTIKYITDNRQEYFTDYKNLMISNGVPEELFHDITGGNPVMKFIDYYSSLNLNIIRDMHMRDTEIIDVPGHSPGSVCIYFNDTHAMITGDHILKNISPNISVYRNNTDYLGMYMESLNKVRSYDVSIAYPGHRDNFTNFSDRIDQILEHHRIRIENMTLPLNQWRNAFEIASSIEWSKGRKLKDMNSMEKNFAIMETIAHLIHMKNLGIIEEKYAGNICMYRALDKV